MIIHTTVVLSLLFTEKRSPAHAHVVGECVTLYGIYTVCCCVLLFCKNERTTNVRELVNLCLFTAGEACDIETKENPSSAFVCFVMLKEQE